MTLASQEKLDVSSCCIDYVSTFVRLVTTFVRLCSLLPCDQLCPRFFDCVHFCFRSKGSHQGEKNSCFYGRFPYPINISGKCDNVYRLKSPLQMYSGFHAPTQLHVALYCIALRTEQNWIEHLTERTFGRKMLFNMSCLSSNGDAVLLGWISWSENWRSRGHYG